MPREEERSARSRVWYREAFDDLYPLRYPHRDEAEAERLVGWLASLGPLDRGPILDIGCGAGRHLAAFQSRGGSPIGLDLSMPLLAQARKRLASVPLARGEMRQLPFRSGAFGWAVMLFTTFGYFDTDEDHRRALAEAYRVLSPGGWFVLDAISAESARRTLEASSRRTDADFTIEEERWIDPSGPFVRKRTRARRIDDGTERIYEERVRLYEPAEIETLLRQTRFEIEGWYGDYEGGRYRSAASPRLLILARAGRGAG